MSSSQSPLAHAKWHPASKTQMDKIPSNQGEDDIFTTPLDAFENTLLQGFNDHIELVVTRKLTGKLTDPHQTTEPEGEESDIQAEFKEAAFKALEERLEKKGLGVRFDGSHGFVYGTRETLERIGCKIDDGPNGTG